MKKYIIVKETDKDGEWYRLYRKGFLSRLGIFCYWNRIDFLSGSTEERLMSNLERRLMPDPPRNPQVIREIEI